MTSLNFWLDDLAKRYPRKIDYRLLRISKALPFALHQAITCPVITIAGTNGKGTTLALLESIYHQQGYQVGSYSSPHLLHFNERIRINAHPIDDAQLCKTFAELDEICQQQQLLLTYFEFITLAALRFFSEPAHYYPIKTKQNMDVILLEVGLGGRLDATNVIDPDLSIITTIDIDHREYLGETREAIAKEKAGIMRPHSPVICGDVNPPNAIAAHAREIQANLYQIEKEFSYQLDESKKTWQWRNNKIPQGEAAHTNLATVVDELPCPNIPITNAATAIMALQVMHPQLPVSHDTIATTLAALQVPGRMQVIKQSPIVIVDVAHNPQSVHYLFTQLKKRLAMRQGHCYAVFSMLADKDIDACFQEMSTIVDHWFIAELQDERAASLGELETAAEKATVSNYTRSENVLLSYQKALEIAAKDDTIIVFGSFHTVSEVLSERGRR